MEYIDDDSLCFFAKISIDRSKEDRASLEESQRSDRLVPHISFRERGRTVVLTVYMGLDNARVGCRPATVGRFAGARVPCFKCRIVYRRHSTPLVAPVHHSDTYFNHNTSIRARVGNAEASSVMTERMKETVSLCASAFLLTVSALTVAVDTVNGSAVGHLQDSGVILMEASNASRTNETIAPNASKAPQSRWYGHNPFVAASTDAERPQSAPALAFEASRMSSSRTASGESAATSLIGQDIESLLGRIQWLNQVTLRITDELEVAHPPPLKNLIAQVTNSGLAEELEGVGKVFGTVASDLKEGFVGLVGTIESISRGEDSGIHLPGHLNADKASVTSLTSTDAAQRDGDP